MGGVLDLLLGPSTPRAAASGYSYDADGFPVRSVLTRAGVRVDDTTALYYAPVWLAARTVAETLAMMPLVLYRRTEDGRERAAEHPLYRLLDVEPSPGMAAMPFREGRGLHLEMQGNAFAEIERAGTDGAVTALWPIHPSRVRQPQRGDRYNDGRPMDPSDYIVRNDDGREVGLPARDVLHIPGVFSEDGRWGKGIVDYARDTLGYGLAVERYGANYFKGGGQPKAILYLPGMRDKRVRQEYREEWREVHNADNGGDLVILPPEGKYDKLSHTPEEAQYLQTRAYNVKNVARFFRIPVYLLEEYEKAASYASVEMRGLEFITYSLLPRARRWEGQIGLKLLSRNEQADYYAEYLFSSLLRGDFASRMTAYQTALTNGLMTINECRRLENLPGIGEAGDQHYVPMNMTTAQRMMEGEEEPTPTMPTRGAPPTPAEEDGDEEEISAALADIRTTLKGFTVSASVPETPPTSQGTTAARIVLADATRRWLVKFASAASAEAKNADFPGWLADYGRRQRAALAESLAPAAGVLATFGEPADAGALADRLLADTTAELSAAYETDTREAFAARLRSWPAKAATVAESLWECVSCPST